MIKLSFLILECFEKNSNVLKLDYFYILVRAHYYTLFSSTSL